MSRPGAFLTVCSFAMMLSCPTVFAQGFLSRGELGVAVGGMNYIGDLNHQRLDGTVRPAAAIFGRYCMGDRWAAAVSLGCGQVAGGDPDVDKLRNLSFRSRIFEASLRLEFNFVPFGAEGFCFRTAPYLFAGVGLFHFNPQARYRDPVSGRVSWVDLQPLRTEGQGSGVYPDRVPYSLMQTVLPFGLGFKMALSKSVTLAVEYGYRLTWTDYLDDVSTTYVGDQVLGTGTTAAALADRSGEVCEGYVNMPGIQRGDDSLDDAYAFFNVSLTVSMEALFGWLRSKRCEL
ncbi:MAG: hypothetical protein AUK63_965 [bacterium P3]|nr:MAG: hypothetical protein AUK63_965 [bacterium P3]KWW41029.1 MAG: hypothetical protein F083_1196 [bacterium F083]